MSFQEFIRTALAVAMVCTGMPALAEGPAALDIGEPKAILKVVLSEMRSVERCGLYPSWAPLSSWAGNKIPAGLARSYLDLDANQDIEPPVPAVGFEAIVDPGPIGAAAYCDSAAEEAYAKELAKVDSSGYASFSTTGFSFPVFNKLHTRAVVLENEFLLVWRTEGDRVLRSHGEGGGDAVVLEKDHGTWKIIKRVRTWIT